MLSYLNPFSYTCSPNEQTIKISDPYYCKKCRYIWNHKKYYIQHLDFCDSPKIIKISADDVGAEFYDPKADIKDFPKNRCKVILENGSRRGEHCLRKTTAGETCNIHFHHNFSESSLNLSNNNLTMGDSFGYFSG